MDNAAVFLLQREDERLADVVPPRQPAWLRPHDGALCQANNSATLANHVLLLHPVVARVGRFFVAVEAPSKVSFYLVRSIKNNAFIYVYKLRKYKENMLSAEI